MSAPVVIVGFGGHGRVVAAALEAAGRVVVAATDLNPQACIADKIGFDVITDQELVKRFPPGAISLVLGLGSLWPCQSSCSRCRTAREFQNLGYHIEGVRHPTAWIAPGATVSETAQVHAGVIIQPGAVIGDFAIVNTRSSVDHDCIVGACCHLAPGVTLSGHVEVGRGSHIGTGANVIQGIRVGESSFIAAGATVTREVSDGTFVRGTPARAFTPNR